MSDGGMNTVIKAFYIDPKHAIKVRLGCALRIADVRNAGVIYQNADPIMPENFREPSDYFGLISNVAGVRRSSTSRAGNFGRDGFGVFCADIDNVDSGAIRCEFVRNRSANSAPAASNDCRLPVEAKLASASIFTRQRETPRFQGMKSS
jgi:hypothetical protein